VCRIRRAGQSAVGSILAVALLASACGSTKAPTAEPSSPAVTRFPAGIYFLTPDLEAPTGRLTLLGGRTPVDVDAPVVGFDLRADSVAFPALGGNVITIVGADGTTREVTLQPPADCIGHLARSPDGTQAVVMGSVGGCPPGRPPSNIDIFLADLGTGSTEALVEGPHNEEFPEWSPAGDRISYFIGDPALARPGGKNLALYDPFAKVPAGGAHDLGVDQTAFSKDGALVLSGHTLSVYDVATGGRTARLRAAARRGLARAGYRLDTRFPGQAGGGTFPLDGDFSPDGKSIVFDGSVRRGRTYGMLLCRIDIDGSNFEVLAGPFPVEPGFTNNLNWSSLNPTWLG